MTIGEAQRAVDDWIRHIGGGYFSHLTNMALLTEEVGELARVIARTYGEQVAKPGDLRHGLSEELADVMWVLICLANQSGIDLDAALADSLEKKRRRDADRFAGRRQQQCDGEGKC
ncbi:MAG: nucleotide pyrophosphohydrolase [Muribaculaceae bacterium]|nr:nucleotide pyrophosphohydrolase [Muribaculaceae bacterium]